MFYRHLVKCLLILLLQFFFGFEANSCSKVPVTVVGPFFLSLIIFMSTYLSQTGEIHQGAGSQCSCRTPGSPQTEGGRNGGWRRACALEAGVWGWDPVPLAAHDSDQVIFSLSLPHSHRFPFGAIRAPTPWSCRYIQGGAQVRLQLSDGK